MPIKNLFISPHFLNITTHCIVLNSLINVMCAFRTRFDPKVVLFSCTKYSFYKPLFGPLRQQLVAAFASFDRKNCD